MGVKLEVFRVSELRSVYDMWARALSEFESRCGKRDKSRVGSSTERVSELCIGTPAEGALDVGA